VNSAGDAYVTGFLASSGNGATTTIKYGTAGEQLWVQSLGVPYTAPIAMTLGGGGALFVESAGGGSQGPSWVTTDYVQDAAEVNVESVSFGNVVLKTQSASKTVTLTNTAEVAMTQIAVTVTGDFQLNNNCPSSLAAHSSCTIGVVFTPTQLGTRTGVITVHDDWVGSVTNPETVSLTGNGIS
jgi:hypothetical protein